MRRSQATLFIIIGLFLVVTVVVVVYINNISRPHEIITPDDYTDDVKPAAEFVDSCLKKTAIAGMEKLGEQGMIEPEFYLATKTTKISYFYIKGKNHFPEKSEIEDQLSAYVEENIAGCILGFDSPGIVIEPRGDPKAVSLIEKGDVKVSLAYTIRVYNAGMEYDVKNYVVSIPASFDDIYAVSKTIIQDTMKDPDWIDFSKLYQEPFDIKLIKVDKTTLVYEITDNEHGIENRSYTYRFALKYSF